MVLPHIPSNCLLNSLSQFRFNCSQTEMMKVTTESQRQENIAHSQSQGTKERAGGICHGWWMGKTKREYFDIGLWKILNAKVM